MTEITKTTHDVKVTRYTWDCPGCGDAMRQSNEPKQDDLLCYPCFSKRERESWQRVHNFLIGTTVTALEWTAGMGFRGMTVQDADGNEWAIRGPTTCEKVIQ